jgi:hypothetical protein
MKVRQLRDVLEGFAREYEESGDERKAQGLRSLANLLRGRDAVGVRPFLAKIDRARSKSA